MSTCLCSIDHYEDVGWILELNLYTVCTNAFRPSYIILIPVTKDTAWEEPIKISQGMVFPVNPHAGSFHSLGEGER